jgi:hypothetical protein
MSKMDEYTPGTLEKYSKAVLDELMKSVSEIMPSANDEPSPE